MITLHNNDGTGKINRKNKFKFKVKTAKVMPWEMRQGHTEDRADTSFDNRPKRMRTRKAIDKQWRQEYDM